jgi:hypothetical protein
MTKIFFLAIFTSVTFLSGCSIIPNDNLLRIKCDSFHDEICEIRTNVLICNKDNTHCEYIDVPITDSEH